MLTHPAPATNAERQRQFRARNPGYNRKYRNRSGHPQDLAESMRRAADLATSAKQEAASALSASPDISDFSI
jgi:hypothetical protein